MRQHVATSLAEVDKATLRLVALRTSRNTSDAAIRLGMAPVSLSRWIDRRRLRRVLADQREPRLQVESATAPAAGGDHGSHR